MRPRTRRADDRTRILTAAIVLAGAIAAVGACGTTEPFQHSVSTIRSTASLQVQPRLWGELQSQPSGFTYDPGTDSVWFAETGFGSSNYLDRLSAATGEISRFELPTSDFAGPDSQIKVDAAGNVWMSDGYVLLRFDATTERVTELTFAASDPNETAASDDPLLGGSWITAIGIDGNDVLVARRNVSAVISIDSSMTEVKRFVVPANYAGATDIAVDSARDEVLLLEGNAVGKQLGLFTRDGQLLRNVDVVGRHLTSTGGSFVISDGADNGAILTVDASTATVTKVVAGSVGSLAAPDPAGSEVIYNDRLGTVDRVTAGKVTASYVLPLVTVYPRGGKVEALSTKQRIIGLVVDKLGNIWFATTAVKQVQEIVDGQ